MNRDALLRKLAKALKTDLIAVGESFDSLDTDFEFMDEVKRLPDQTSRWNRDHWWLYREIENAVRHELKLPGKPTRYVPYAALQEKEIDRALVLSREHAQGLSQDATIRRFRARHLQGRELSDDEAKALLERCDALPRTLCDRLRWGLFCDLNSSVIAEGGDDARYEVLERDGRYVAASWDLPDDVFIELPYLKPQRLVRMTDGQPADPALVALNVDLHTLATDIAARLDLSKGQATWHVLTGKTPLRVPVHVELLTTVRLGDAQTTISVTYAPWISPRTVGRVDRDARKRLAMAEHGLNAHGRSWPRTLSVHRFVRAQEALRGHRSPFSELMAAWNDKYGQTFEPFTDPRRFWEAFDRVEKGLAGR